MHHLELQSPGPPRRSSLAGLGLLSHMHLTCSSEASTAAVNGLLPCVLVAHMMMETPSKKEERKERSLKEHMYASMQRLESTLHVPFMQAQVSNKDDRERQNS